MYAGRGRDTTRAGCSGRRFRDDCGARPRRFAADVEAWSTEPVGTPARAQVNGLTGSLRSRCRSRTPPAGSCSRRSHRVLRMAGGDLMNLCMTARAARLLFAHLLVLLPAGCSERTPGGPQATIAPPLSPDFFAAAVGYFASRARAPLLVDPRPLRPEAALKGPDRHVGRGRRTGAQRRVLARWILLGRTQRGAGPCGLAPRIRSGAEPRSRFVEQPGHGDARYVVDRR